MSRAIKVAKFTGVKSLVHGTMLVRSLCGAKITEYALARMLHKVGAYHARGLSNPVYLLIEHNFKAPDFTSKIDVAVAFLAPENYI